MVSTQQKIINSAKRRQATRAASATADAFNKKQSQFARRAEEERIRDETAPSAFEREGRSAHNNRGSASALARGPTRRQAKFHLEDANAPAPLSVDAELGALLGTSAAVPAPSADDAGGDDARRGKRERFDEVIDSTRKSRAEIQRQRDERQKATDALDGEYDAVAHLLAKRDKRQEDIDAFAVAGRPEVRALLSEHVGARTAASGRKFVLGADGALVKHDLGGAASTANTAAPTRTAVPAPPVAAAAVPPAKVASTSATSTAGAAAVAAAAPRPADDDFDAMMGSFRNELRRAHAVERVLLPEEEAAREVQQQLLQLDRAQRPVGEAVRDRDRTRGEWVAAGGDQAFDMVDDDEYQVGDDEDGAAPKVRQTHEVDEVLARVEAFAADPPADSNARSTALSEFASELWHAAVKQKKHTEESFKLVLIDCQRLLLKGRPLKPFHRVVLYLATKVFPLTDFRHVVMTPVMVLLSSLCMQARLTSVAACREALWSASLLLYILAASERFASEPIAVALNVIAMQLPKAAIVPETHGQSRGAFPVLERSAAALLALDGADPKWAPAPLPLLEPSEADSSARGGDARSRYDTVAAAYKLLLNAAELYRESPSFGCIFETSFVLSFNRIMRQKAVLHPAIDAVHRKVVERVAMLAAETAMNRTPLMMRQFRPRPLRQFEPLLGDDTPSEKKQLRQIKKEYHEDHRRAMRTLTAEARVEQRNREAEHRADDARRQAKLNSIVAELQQQQHIMKTADSLKLKAAGKKRAATNVVPKGKRAGGGGDD